MSILNTILQKLGLEKPPAPAAQAKPAPAAPAATTKPEAKAAPAAAPKPAPAAAAKPEAKTAPSENKAAGLSAKPSPAPTHTGPAIATKATPDPDDPAAKAAKVTPPTTMAKAEPAPAPAPEPEPVKPISLVDVHKQMETLALSHPGLNWKNSIADLLKMLDIDNSYAARKELAIELGCPPKLMEDSFQMNVWLHKTVLQKIAENGGHIPQEMLD